MKKEPIKEPCDWWWHGEVPTTARNGYVTLKSKHGTFCNNKESENYLSRVCSPETRETCPDHTVNRNVK